MKCNILHLSNLKSSLSHFSFSLKISLSKIYFCEMIASYSILLCIAIVGIPSIFAAGDINDVKHIVVFMQENRAFDHYYGTLKGVRGYNDRTSPLLPSGLSPFYQPIKGEVTHSILCGCYSLKKPDDSCKITFNRAGADLKGIIMSATCPVITDVLKGATPSITIKDGESCGSLLAQVYNARIEGLVVKDYITSAPSCPSDLHVKTNADANANTSLLKNDPTENYLLPYPLMFNDTSATCMGAPEMAYESNMNMLRGGRVDAWNTARNPGYGMSYFNRTDLPYYYQLADTFTISDSYFQSTFTATCPNREMLFSGSNGLSVASLNPPLNPKQYCMLDDSEPTDPGFQWETMAETLMKNNVSWKLYQGNDNFDDNGFAWFDTFRDAKEGDALYDLGMKRVNSTSPYGFIQAFEQDIINGTLPQVSWLVGPAALSEHASNHPQSGEDLSHRIMKILQRHPDVYKNMAFILNYDEGGQFYDHAVPPLPPTNATMHGGGQSTVTTDGELTLESQFNIDQGHPIGLGWRVPMMLISPWTRGGYVFSEVSDHTSVIQFIEQRFNVHCPNISPWRRAVTSDLTSAFDFTKPDYSWPATFPKTINNVNISQKQCDENPPPAVPTEQNMATQESGVKKQRAIPSYVFNVVDSIDTTSKSINFNIQHVGKTTAGSFSVYDRAGVGSVNNYTQSPPRWYTVESKKSITTKAWNIDATDGYELYVHGPNGFVRVFRGNGVTDSLYNVTLQYSPTKQHVILTMFNHGTTKDQLFFITDMAYGGQPQTITVKKGQNTATSFDVSKSGNWYDIAVTTSNEKLFLRRFMGKMETGKDTTTDPAMGRGIPALGHEDAAVEKARIHPPMPSDVAALSHSVWSVKFEEEQCGSERGRFKDACWDYYHPEKNLIHENEL